MNLELPVHFCKKHVSLLSEGNKLEGFLFAGTSDFHSVAPT